MSNVVCEFRVIASLLFRRSNLLNDAKIASLQKTLLAMTHKKNSHTALMSIDKKICLLIFHFTITFLGCSAPSAPQSLSEANKKLIAICRDEYQLPVRLFPLKNTLYIYLPMEQRIVDFQASPQKTAAVDQAQSKMTVLYNKVDFSEGQFSIAYDIALSRSYPKDPGYATPYTKEFIEKQRRIFMAIFQAYADLVTQRLPGDDWEYLNSEEQRKREDLIHYQPATAAPDFIVLVAADVKTGIEIENILYFQDFKRAWAGELPQEEYSQRTLFELRGSRSIIGDDAGEHLTLQEIEFPAFLAKQMQNRINFKYQQSDFPPGDNTQEEITKIAAETLRTYSFKNFQSIILEDLNAGTKIAVNP